VDLFVARKIEAGSYQEMGVMSRERESLESISSREESINNSCDVFPDTTRQV